MVRAIVVSDALGAAHASELEGALARLGIRVDREERSHYPIADSMTAFLQSRSARADVCIAVISAHPNAAVWVARELCNDLLYPTWFMAFAPGVDVPDRFRGVTRLILPEGDPGATVAAALGLSTLGDLQVDGGSRHGSEVGASTSTDAAQHRKPVE